MKKIISVLLALIISLDIMHVCSVKASAAAAVGELGGELGGALIAIFSGTIKDLSGQCLKNQNEEYLQKINRYSVERGDFINLVYSDGGYKFISCTPLEYEGTPEAEFAKFFADYLNEHASTRLITDFIADNSEDREWHCPATSYIEAKDLAADAFQNYLHAKAKLEADLEGGDELTEVDGLAHYDFDFVGPLPYITMPTTTGYVQADIKGYRITAPRKIVQSDGYFPSEEAAKLFGATNTVKWGEKKIGGLYSIQECYGCGTYVIFENVIYYKVFAAHTPSAYTRQFDIGFKDGNQLQYLSSSNEKLSDAGCGSFLGLYGGIYYCYDKNAVGNYPIFTEQDVGGNVGGGTVDMCRLKAEEDVGRLIGAGIASKYSELTLDENGNIIGVDGVSLDTLMNMLDSIANGQIKLEDIEGYLQLITQFLEKSNENTSAIEKIQENILEMEKTRDDAMSDIRDTLKTISESISESYDISEVDTEFDVTTPDTITDKFPFSLPFDIYKVFNLLSAEPVAPKWTFEIDMTTVGGNVEKIDVDLSKYNWLAEIVRWLIYVAAIIGLILVTNKLIGRG